MSGGLADIAAGCPWLFRSTEVNECRLKAIAPSSSRIPSRSYCRLWEEVDFRIPSTDCDAGFSAPSLCATVHSDVEEEAVEGAEGLETGDGIETGAPTMEVAVAPVWDEDVDRGDDPPPVAATGGGLSPPAPSSVDPIGIPTRPTGAAATMPVGDEADAVGRAKAVLAPDMQVPDTVPLLPSNIEPNPVMDEVADPVADDVPVGAPKEACGIEPPKPEQTAISLVERPLGVVPGEVPGAMSSVAPRGIPVGATGGAAPIPSGEVMPRPEGEAPPIAPT